MDKIKHANRSLLGWAVVGDAKGLKRALAAGADLGAKDDNGGTSAMWAARNGHVDCLRLLADAGADLDARDLDGWTAAMFSAGDGNEGCLSLLIAAGADLDALDNKGSSASMIAEAHGRPGLVAFIAGLVRSKNEAAELGLAAGPGHGGLPVGGRRV